LASSAESQWLKNDHLNNFYNFINYLRTHNQNNVLFISISISGISNLSQVWNVYSIFIRTVIFTELNLLVICKKIKVVLVDVSQLIFVTFFSLWANEI